MQGLDEVLRFHVEADITNPNDIMPTIPVRPLAFATIVSNDVGVSCLKYLLTCSNVKLCVLHEGGYQLIHYCAVENERISLEAFDLITQHPEVEVNSLNEEGFSFLHNLALKPHERAPAKLKMWLLNGGDPEIVETTRGMTGWEIIEMKLRLARQTMELARQNMVLARLRGEQLGTEAEVDQAAIEHIPYLEEMQVILLEAANAEAIRGLFI